MTIEEAAVLQTIVDELAAIRRQIARTNELLGYLTPAPRYSTRDAQDDARRALRGLADTSL